MMEGKNYTEGRNGNRAKKSRMTQRFHICTSNILIAVESVVLLSGLLLDKNGFVFLDSVRFASIDNEAQSILNVLLVDFSAAAAARFSTVSPDPKEYVLICKLRAGFRLRSGGDTLTPVTTTGMGVASALDDVVESDNVS